MRKPCPIVRALEHSRVDFPVELDTSRNHQRLEDASARVGRRAFETRSGRLFTKGVVGVVDTGNLIVEILPKIHRGGGINESRQFLIDLLQFTASESGIAVAAGRVDAGSNSLMELFLSWIVSTVLDHVSSGIPRRYVVREEISTAVRGRISLHRLARAAPGKAFELTVRHAPLSQDNALTRILRWLLVQVRLRSRSQTTRARCDAALDALRGAKDVAAADLPFERVSLTPWENHWESVVEFAKALAREAPPNATRAGTLPSLAILFTLHDLFETALRQVFRTGLKGSIVLTYSPRKYLLQSSSDPGVTALRLKPDFVFRSVGENAELAPGDAKWKDIIGNAPDVRLEAADAYQLSAYLLALRAAKGFIFCPDFTRHSTVPTLSRWALAGDEHSLSVVSVSLPLLIAKSPAGEETRQNLCATVREVLAPSGQST